MPRKGSGVQTMADLKQRCLVSEMTDCWRWQGSIVRGQPRLWVFDRLVDKSHVVSGPRAAALLGGFDIFKGWRCWMTCLRSDCVNPAHVMTGTVAQWGKWMADNGKMADSPVRKRASERRWLVKMPERAAAALKVLEAPSEMTGLQLAQELNLTPQRVSLIRNGHRWAHLRGPNVFAGLGAR